MCPPQFPSFALVALVLIYLGVAIGACNCTLNGVGTYRARRTRAAVTCLKAEKAKRYRLCFVGSLSLVISNLHVLGMLSNCTAVLVSGVAKKCQVAVG